MEELHQKIKNAIEFINTKPEIPEYIFNNIKYPFFDWQKEALEYFLLYEENSKSKNELTHLMFNMATGSGKTLLMAALILYYYKQGYRHFIFFVNRNNIVDKTENNFLNVNHKKYLFKDKIVIDDKIVNILKVDTFSDNPQNIEIKFTSIQKLYNDIHKQKENQTTLDDLNSKNIILLADEAHHLNTDTDKLKNSSQEIYSEEITNKTSEVVVEKKGWEHTVIDLIFKKNNKKVTNKNVLLEFTATIPSSEKIAKKYENKIIYKFTLKEFLKAGYTKEINLIASTLDKKERILHALMFQWFRHKIALDNNISNFKPVILFRSKIISESFSDYDFFNEIIARLQIKNFDFIKSLSNSLYDSMNKNLFETGKKRSLQLLEYVKKKKIHLSEIKEWIKYNYSEKNIIITNTRSNTTQKEKTTEEIDKLLNSLEDSNNHIRAIFTVERLTEGWDVLNLFDIVRLYEGQNAGGSNKTTPVATVQEKQLIGRGVRYFPFEYKNKLHNKRKFDKDIDNELRLLEELYYYTYDEESRYISHLKQELKKDGYISDDKVYHEFNLKPDFIKSNFYNDSHLWYNERENNPNAIKNTLDSIRATFNKVYRIRSLQLSEFKVNFDRNDDVELQAVSERVSYPISVKFKEVEKHIIYKAINIKAQQDNSILKFENLKNLLAITSIDDLFLPKFLGDFDISLRVDKYNFDFEDLSNLEKLNICLDFLTDIMKELQESNYPYKGGKFKYGRFSQFFNEPKIKAIDSNTLDKSIPESNSWYVLDTFAGTSEEKGLIQFIKDTFNRLESIYDEKYLLRNEEVFTIYDFEQGRGFQPDFLLLLKGKNNLYYQIFIEPKGNQFLDLNNTFEYSKEGWKEKFLIEISKQYGAGKIVKAVNKEYILIGLPFFNKEHNDKFEEEFSNLLN